MMRFREAREQKQSQNGVAENGHQHGDQTHELKPIARGHSFATSTHGLFGQEVQSTAVAIHGYLSHPDGIQTAIASSLLRLGRQKLLVRGPVLVRYFFFAQKFRVKEVPTGCCIRYGSGVKVKQIELEQ